MLRENRGLFLLLYSRAYSNLRANDKILDSTIELIPSLGGIYIYFFTRPDLMRIFHILYLDII